MKTTKILKRTVKVESDRKTGMISIVAIINNITNEDITERFREECPGYWEDYRSLEDLKETLNWAFNGDPKKYKFKWEFNGEEKSWGIAEIYD